MRFDLWVLFVSLNPGWRGRARCAIRVSSTPGCLLKGLQPEEPCTGGFIRLARSRSPKPSGFGAGEAKREHGSPQNQPAPRKPQVCSFIWVVERLSSIALNPSGILFSSLPAIGTDCSKVGFPTFLTPAVRRQRPLGRRRRLRSPSGRFAITAGRPLFFSPSSLAFPPGEFVFAGPGDIMAPYGTDFTTLGSG